MNLAKVDIWKRNGLQFIGLLGLSVLALNLWDAFSEGRLRGILIASAFVIVFLPLCIPLLSGKNQPLGITGKLFWAIGMAMAFLCMVFIPHSTRI